MMQNLRIESVQKGEKITIFVNGQKTIAYKGESVHAALIAAGYQILRKSKSGTEARGIFCGMGICYDCLVSINGNPNERACMKEVEEQMEIVIDEAQL